MELEGWRRVGEGWRVGAAENNKTGGLEAGVLAVGSGLETADHGPAREMGRARVAVRKVRRLDPRACHLRPETGRGWGPGLVWRVGKARKVDTAEWAGLESWAGGLEFKQTANIICRIALLRPKLFACGVNHRSGHGAHGFPSLQSCPLCVTFRASELSETLPSPPQAMPNH